MSESGRLLPLPLLAAIQLVVARSVALSGLVLLSRFQRSELKLCPRIQSQRWMLGRIVDDCIDVTRKRRTPNIVFVEEIPCLN